MRSKRFIEAGGIVTACFIFFISLFLFVYQKKGLFCASFRKVLIKKNKEGGYSLFVRGKPFFIRGVIYNPTPIGEGYDYDLSLDKTEPWLYDGKLMKEMGINCVRIYKAGSNLERTKKFIRDLYEKFGIYTIVSDWLGLWDKPSPNYADKEFCQKVKERVLRMVNALKEEEGVLMWVLGNENNYTFSGEIAFWTSEEIEKMKKPYDKIKKRARIYYSFVNELAKEIKKIDKNHLVALGNGELTHLNLTKQICKDIDVLAIISYRGKRFGNLFENVRYILDKPVLISEFGCDSYHAEKHREVQDIQAEYLVSQWEDIIKNSVFGGNKRGNCLGGTMFEWTDEWWKYNEGYIPGWSVHNTEADWSNGSYYFDIRAENNLNMNEEWFGIVALSKEKENGLNKRYPKKAFYVLKEMWGS